MIPTLLHPLFVFGGKFITVKVLGPFIPLRSSIPDRKLILDKESLFISNIIPFFRRKTDTVPERICEHIFLKFLVHLSNPVIVPWKASAFRIFKETIHCNISSSEKIWLPV